MEDDVKSFTLRTNDKVHEFDGVQLGAATSESGFHNHPGDFLDATVPPQTGRRTKCSACRWLETSIYLTRDDKYVVHTIGRTIVPGEEDRHRVTFTSSAYEIVEVLTVKSAPEPF